MSIIGQNALLNQYVPTIYIKDLLDGQTLRYDSTRRAFVNATGGGGSGANKLGELLNVSPTVDSPSPSLANGQSLIYNSFTSLWENQYIGGAPGTAGQVLTSNGAGFTPTWQTVVGSGSVTSVSVVTANGVSGSVVNPTTTPAITLTLGAITPTSISTTGSITAGGTISGSNLSGVNTGNQVISLSGDATNSNTSTGGVLTLTTVNPNVGTFGSATQVPVFTVDSKGRITGVTNTTISTTSGTVTSVTANGTQGITTLVTNGTTTPNIAIGLGAITPTSVAASGTIGGSNLSGTNTGDQTITLTGDVAGSGTGSFATTLANSGVTANTYGSATQVPVFTVDSKGRITGVTNTTISTTSGTVTSVSATGSTDITVGGSPITTSGTLTFALSNTTVTPGAYTLANITIDSKGRITSASNGSAGIGTVTSVGISGANGIGVASSPITTSGTIALSLGAITPSSVAAVGTVTGSNLSGTHTGSSSGTNTGDQTITLTGAVTGTGTGSFATTYAGSISTVPGNLPISKLNSGAGASGTTFWRGDGVWATPAGGGTVTSTSVTSTADITGTVATPTTTPALSLLLTTTGVSAATYGSATQVPVFAVDSKGRITSVTNTTITAAPTAPEVVVWHYSSGGSGNFTPVDALFSQTAGVTAVITDGANCIATYTFTGKANPPKSITFYGQNFSANTFAISGVPGPNAALANIKIAGGGTAASPDLANGIFSASNVITLQTTMTNVGASSTIGNRAWCIVVFGF